ncbi:MAG TPA: hypothetical protein PKO42_00095 [Tenuifilaceae bacterium]|jgi:hypothetical protein|nr:hypothetical protein [Bacteroidales bacterium]HNY08262.1 hypothetical protein [Tenuifilaceae bacterium]MBP8643104.1 hypothetical protein [Bacteroidales bacterium]NLI88778.1 hypothetical protein [Bacteroidales bacterium]HOA09440.1 hypothetical protein [Tenuifilaceae bacterium]
MKREVRIVGTIFLVALYCFAASVVCIPKLVPLEEPHNGPGYFFNASSNLLSLTLPSKNPAGSIGLSPIWVLKNQLKDFSYTIKSVELFLSTIFTQYRNVSISYPIRLRKTDLLYPFQYFW